MTFQKNNNHLLEAFIHLLGGVLLFVSWQKWVVTLLTLSDLFIDVQLLPQVRGVPPVCGPFHCRIQN